MSQSLKSLLRGTQKPVIGRVDAYLGNGRFRVSYQGKQAIVIGTAGIVVGRKVLLSATPNGIIISGTTTLMEEDTVTVQLDEL